MISFSLKNKILALNLITRFFEEVQVIINWEQ